MGDRPALIFGALGGASISALDGERHRAKAGIQASLFAQLLLHRGDPVSFDNLENAVWGERGIAPRAMRNNLRVHMSYLRKWARQVAGESADEYFETIGTSYRLDVDAEQYDVARFERSVALGQRAVLAGELEQADRHLSAALAMWADPYPELQMMPRARSEAVRLNELYELAVDESIEVSLQQGAAGELIGELEARVIAHPFRERTHGQLMQALYRSGRQADSLAAYQRARQCLLDELGLEPGEQLRALEASILGQTEPAGSAVGRPPVTLEAGGDSRSSAAAPFVGRSAQVDAAVASVRTGCPLVILGEPGMGKTRLIRQVEAAEALAGATWVWARSSRDGQSTLSSLTEAAGMQPAPVLDARGEFKRNQGLIDALCGDNERTVLVVDDWHWADEPLIRLLRQLIGSRPAGLSIIVSSRNASADLETPAGDALHELAREPVALRIDLDPLPFEAVRAYLKATNADAERAEALHGRSAGNPLFLIELAKADVADTDLDAGDTGSAPVPSAITSLINSRLEPADDFVRTALRQAAVVGSRIDSHRLLAALEVTAAELVMALEFGRRHDLIDATAGGVDTWAHDIVRQSLAVRCSAQEQCEIHDRVATVLAARSHLSDSEKLELAHHAQLALPIGSAQRAVDASMSAGSQAADAFAFADAAAHYAAARAATELLPADDQGAVLAEVLAELGYCMIRGGSSTAGAELLLRALELARSAKNHTMLTRAARCITEASSPPGTDREAISTAVEEAIASTDRRPSEDRVQLLVDLAGLRYFSHPIEHRRELCDEAILLADRLGDRARAIAATGTWSAIYQPETATERHELMVGARKAAQRSDSLDVETVSATMEIATLLELGRGAEADRLMSRHRDRMELLQAPRLQWFVHGWRVLAAMRAGRLDEALDLSEVGLMNWEAGQHPDGLAAFGAQQIGIKLLAGEPESVSGLLEMALAEEPDNFAYRAAQAASQAMMAHDDAHRTTHTLLEQIVSKPLRSDALLTPTLAFAAEAVAAVRDSDPGLARQLAACIEPFADVHVVVNVFGAGGLYWGSLRHSLGLARSAAGDTNGARTALAEAVEAHESAAAPAFARRSAASLSRLQ